MSLRALARGDPKHKSVLAGDSGRSYWSAGHVFTVLSSEGFLLDPARVLTHPGLDQIDGIGIYTYPFNPDETLNFVLGPGRQIETGIQRTIGSSILIQQPQVDEDVVVTEVWNGGDKLSALAEMFRAFYEFSLIKPAVGEALTWEPRDLTEDSFQVHIVDVTLGANDLRYRPVRASQSTLDGSYLQETMTVKYKIVGGYSPPQSVVTLSGI